MDKRKGILNVAVSMGFKITTMLLAVIVKRALIQCCGNEVNGLNALYLSIIGFLSVAELGVGSAITFCMYKPIVEGNQKQVAALYQLFRKLYRAVSGMILIAGFGITPFIHLFAKDYASINVNLYLTFILMLISVVITYFYSAKTSLINAYKNNYITTAITSGGLVFQYILQIVILAVTQSFVGYLVCRIVAAFAQWIITDIVSSKKYSPLMNERHKLDYDTRKQLMKSIKAMFMHKIGYLLVNTVDSMVISIFVGVVALGKYSNYTLILTSLTGVISLVFSSLTSVVGHLYVENSKETARKYCEVFYLLNLLLGTIFYLGYYAIADNLVSILFGKQLIVERSITFVITLNGFIQFMRNNVLLFRDATGTFYNDRWKPLIEGMVNVILSILFVKWVGVTGVIIATIITNLVICHIIEPYVLYKNAFCVSPKQYYLKNYGMIMLFSVALVLLGSIIQTGSNQWNLLFVNGFIAVGIALLVLFVAALFNWCLCKELLNMLRKDVADGTFN